MGKKKTYQKGWLDIYQDGTQEVSFNEQYIDSPKYKERLKKEIDAQNKYNIESGYNRDNYYDDMGNLDVSKMISERPKYYQFVDTDGYDKGDFFLNEEIKERKENLKTVKLDTERKPEKTTILGDYDPIDHSYAVYKENLGGLVNETEEDVTEHEKSHSSTRGDKGLFKATIKKINDFTEENKSLREEGKLNTKNIEYLTDPSEVKARMDSARRYLKEKSEKTKEILDLDIPEITESHKKYGDINEKIHNPLEEDFTKEDYEELKNSKSSDVKELLENFTEEQVIWMMNNIAKADTPIGLNQPLIAKNGLDMYQKGTQEIEDEQNRYQDIINKSFGFHFDYLDSPKYRERLNKEVEAQKALQEEHLAIKTEPHSWEREKYKKDEEGNLMLDENYNLIPDGTETRYLRDKEGNIQYKPRPYNPYFLKGDYSSMSYESEGRDDLGLNTDYLLEQRKGHLRSLNIPRSFEESQKELDKIGGENHRSAGIYSPREHSFGVMSYGDESWDEHSEKTHTHEESHASTRGDLFMMPASRKKIDEFTEQNKELRGLPINEGGLKKYEDKKFNEEYYTDPSEVKARLDVTREKFREKISMLDEMIAKEELNARALEGKKGKKKVAELERINKRLEELRKDRENTHDPFTQDFTDEDVEMMKKMWGPGNSDVNDLLQNFTPEQIKWMMNNIAMNESNDNNVQLAKNGLDMYRDGVSELGYSDGSPYRNYPYLDIHTPSGVIDMSNTGIALRANERLLPPYSGKHKFNTNVVRERPAYQDGTQEVDAEGNLSSEFLGSEENPETLPLLEARIKPAFAENLKYWDNLSEADRDYLMKHRKDTNNPIARSLMMQAAKGYGIKGNPTFYESVKSIPKDIESGIASGIGKTARAADELAGYGFDIASIPQSLLVNAVEEARGNEAGSVLSNLPQVPFSGRESTQRTPSEAWGYENPEGVTENTANLALDMIDPALAFGAGRSVAKAAVKGGKQAAKSLSKTASKQAKKLRYQLDNLRYGEPSYSRVRDLRNKLDQLEAPTIEDLDLTRANNELRRQNRLYSIFDRERDRLDQTRNIRHYFDGNSNNIEDLQNRASRFIQYSGGDNAHGNTNILSNAFNKELKKLGVPFDRYGDPKIEDFETLRSKFLPTKEQEKAFVRRVEKELLNSPEEDLKLFGRNVAQRAHYRGTGELIGAEELRRLREAQRQARVRAQRQARIRNIESRWGSVDTETNKGWPKPEKVNRSGFTKKQALEKTKPESKDLIEKMSEDDFMQTYMRPDGELIPSENASEILKYDQKHQMVTLKDAEPMSRKSYAEEFNKDIDKLNEIIEKNNKSGVKYKVTGLNKDGVIEFETPIQVVTKKLPNGKTYDDLMGGGTNTWAVGLVPAKWGGEVKSIANVDYYKHIPGINMGNTSAGVFSDKVPRAGSGAYKSINEYLKLKGLGRVKPGFNSQTEHSRGLWESSIKKGKGYGFYGNPATLYGSMKTLLPVGAGVGLTAEGYLGYLDGDKKTNSDWLDEL
jgi:hypothetical protein